MVFAGVSWCVLRVWNDVWGWQGNVSVFLGSMIGEVIGVLL